MHLKLSMQTIVDLVNALAALDGKIRGVKEGEREQIVREPYNFGAGLRAAIARNIAKLKRIADEYAKSRDGLILSISGGMTQLEKDNQQQAIEFKKANDVLLADQ